jgi:hypothetical protein
MVCDVAIFNSFTATSNVKKNGQLKFTRVKNSQQKEFNAPFASG